MRLASHVGEGGVRCFVQTMCNSRELHNNSSEFQMTLSAKRATQRLKLQNPFALDVGNGFY